MFEDPKVARARALCELPVAHMHTLCTRIMTSAMLYTCIHDSGCVVPPKSMRPRPPACKTAKPSTRRLKKRDTGEQIKVVTETLTDGQRRGHACNLESPQDVCRWNTANVSTPHPSLPFDLPLACFLSLARVCSRRKRSLPALATGAIMSASIQGEDEALTSPSKRQRLRTSVARL